MSHALAKAQQEIADLEAACEWIRAQFDTGRREAHIAEQHLARQLAELRRVARHELPENAGYVIQDKATKRVFTGVAGNLWSDDIRIAERFFKRGDADTCLHRLLAGMAKRDRWRLHIQPLAKLQAIAQPRSHHDTDH